MKDLEFFVKFNGLVQAYIALCNHNFIKLLFDKSEFSIGERLITKNIYSYGAINMTALAKDTGITAPLLRKSIISLYKKNIIKRTRGKSDQRAIFIELTENGYAKVSELFEQKACLLEEKIKNIVGDGEMSLYKKKLIFFVDTLECYIEYYGLFIRERKKELENLNLYELFSRGGESLNSITNYLNTPKSKLRDELSASISIQRSIIMFLYKNDSAISVSDLGRVFGLNPKHISKILNSLESEGNLEKSQNDNDWRVRNVKLSKKTRENISEGNLQFIKLQHTTYSAAFTDDELDTFCSVCKEINRVLSRL
ncbi:MAG: MarR family transcriptional regulator [Firmicutes bacterium]|nr:MarR family transcriptional regulator [Bacillota bacterium]